MSNYLYRGVGLSMFQNGYALKSKGARFSMTFQFGDISFGEGAVFGSSTSNAVLGHQKDSNYFKTSGISTTPHFDIAKNYALYNENEGIVFKIDRDKINDFRIQEYIVKQYVPFPKKPEDDEVILCFNDELNKKIIVEIIKVSRI